MSLLDKLPSFIPFLNKKTDHEYFFALNIESKVVEAALWGIERGRLEIINIAKVSYLGSDELINAANQALDEALVDFPVEPTKILFGVPDFWMQDDSLKEEHLTTLRNLVKQVDLAPLAYVSSSHAISHLLQKQQGVPLTAVLVNLTDPMAVTVIKAGKVMGSKALKRSENLPEDIEKALLSFTDVEVLPAKILIYGSSTKEEDLEKLKDELLSFPWMQNLPFLHLPKVEVLKDIIAISSIALAGATEIDPDVSFSEQSLSSVSELKPSLTKPMSSQKPPTSKELGDIGFVAGDIDEVSASRKTLPSDEIDMEEEYLGREQSAVSVYDQQGIAPLEKKLLAPLSGILANLGQITGDKKLPLPKVGLLLPLVVLLLLAGTYIFLPKAKVTVFIDPKILEKEAQVTVDPAISTVDEINKKIPGKLIEISLTGTSAGQATGSKQIGDPAKGTVVIYNKTTAPKTFSSGTVLAADNLQFSLDSSVTIASQSAVEGGISFGKTTANATASSIGPDGNLPAGKEIGIKGQDSAAFSAKVDQAFSGGTSKNVTIVTADDQKKLLAQAISNLRQKAKDSLQAQLTDGYRILPEALAENVTNSSYSKNVNDQASEFNVSVSVKFKGTAYQDKDLKTMVSQLVQTNVPQGYTMDLEDAETQSDIAKLNPDGTLVFQAKFKAKLLPKLDQDKIKSQIRGKTPAQAAQILKTIENVISSEFDQIPSLPGFLGRLPLLSRNITIDISAK